MTDIRQKLKLPSKGRVYGVRSRLEQPPVQAATVANTAREGHDELLRLSRGKEVRLVGVNGATHYGTLTNSDRWTITIQESALGTIQPPPRVFFKHALESFFITQG
jgi:hypothetical protein